ncbi:hypothetical protein HPB51_003607 [Rhipicephalus microplus]|uniref:Uncharacterized protein n=1 Tax=Rhipicephalus microplus TaxID=6941 RepID=A0A9J6DYE6_RHIMP|nr:hypothetical protein HPB51_003607 [Rhipicephalus microplus]
MIMRDAVVEGSGNSDHLGFFNAHPNLSTRAYDISASIGNAAPATGIRSRDLQGEVINTRNDDSMEPATNGCKDGPTPLLVQNHSEGTAQQEKKSPEKHGTKAAVTQDTPTVTSRAARHSNANSKASTKSSAASAAASTGNKASSATAAAAVSNSDAAAPSTGSRRTPRNCAPGSSAGASSTAGRVPAKPPPRESSSRRGAAPSTPVESAPPASSPPPA